MPLRFLICSISLRILISFLIITYPRLVSGILYSNNHKAKGPKAFYLKRIVESLKNSPEHTVPSTFCPVGPIARNPVCWKSFSEQPNQLYPVISILVKPLEDKTLVALSASVHPIKDTANTNAAIERLIYFIIFT
ncbi:hypothetical protein [Escherichia phage FL12]